MDKSLGWGILGFISSSRHEYEPSSRDWRNKCLLGYSPGEIPPKADKYLDILSNFLFILALVLHYTICCWAVYKLFLLLKLFVTKLLSESFGYYPLVYFPVIIGPGMITGVFVFMFDQSIIGGFRKLLDSLLLNSRFNCPNLCYDFDILTICVPSRFPEY